MSISSDERGRGLVPAFDVLGVDKRFGDLVALGSISISVDAGETVAIVGPSGSGKTTLLRLLGGVLAPDHGTILVDGEELALLDRQARAARVGMMHQQFDLVPNLAVVHNVLAGNLGRWRLFRSLLSLIRPVGLDQARGALERVGIEDRLYERASVLSGGEQQRVALARLLVQGPLAVLADEPVSSLDPARAEALVQLLVRMATEGGHTLVVSLHSVQLALDNFDRILALRQGAVVFDRPASEVSNDELGLLYRLEAEEIVTGTERGALGS